MLLYNGPINVQQRSPFEVKYNDYLLIALENGALIVDMQFNGVAKTRLSLRDVFNDMKFHKVRLTQRHKAIELVVDDCKFGPNQDSPCYTKVLSSDDDERLNVVMPLQVGGVAPGVYPEPVNTLGSFGGCIRNLYVNNDVRSAVVLL